MMTTTVKKRATQPKDDSKVSILLVDDSPDKLYVLEHELKSLNQNIVKATSGEEALRLLLRQDFALILLDVRMPGMDGFETASLIRQRKNSEYTPIIFITGIDRSETNAFKGYSLGAVDYLFTPVEREVLLAKVTVFIELYRKTQEVKRSRQLLAEEVMERKAAEEKILEISGREQRRLGQELHDGLGQTLTGISFLSRVLAKKLADKSAPEAAEAERVCVLVTEAIRKTKDLARGFYPVELESNGLVSALHELASREESLFEIKCQFATSEKSAVSDLNMATQVYRIAQEAIENAIKHGNAQSIKVSLVKHDNLLKLTIEDDGVGFPDKLPEKHGMGLQIMKYRAGMIHGWFEIRRAGQRGTLVTCTFPDSDHQS